MAIPAPMPIRMPQNAEPDGRLFPPDPRPSAKKTQRVWGLLWVLGWLVFCTFLVLVANTRDTTNTAPVVTPKPTAPDALACKSNDDCEWRGLVCVTRMATGSRCEKPWDPSKTAQSPVEQAPVASDPAEDVRQLFANAFHQELLNLQLDPDAVVANGTRLVVSGKFCSQQFVFNFVQSPDAKMAKADGFTHVECQRGVFHSYGAEL